jgi:hypothetical protein
MTEPIPAGYQIHFNSWENDADARGTKIWSGIESPEDVKFLLILAYKFSSRNAVVSGIGNDGVTVDTMIDTVENALASVPGISFDMRALFDAEREDADDEDLADRWYDLIAERILGYPVEEYYRDETRFCRVFESAQIYYFPQPVEEVTGQFA